MQPNVYSKCSADGQINTTLCRQNVVKQDATEQLSRAFSKPSPNSEQAIAVECHDPSPNESLATCPPVSHSRQWEKAPELKVTERTKTISLLNGSVKVWKIMHNRIN